MSFRGAVGEFSGSCRGVFGEAFPSRNEKKQFTKVPEPFVKKQKFRGHLENVGSCREAAGAFFLEMVGTQSGAEAAIFPTLSKSRLLNACWLSKYTGPDRAGMK